MRALRPPSVSAGPLRWLGLAMLALAVVFPLFGGPFYTRLGIETLLLGSVALSVDILLGYAGLLSLGQAAYFGLAAYIAALMYLHVTQSFWLVMLTVMAAVGVFSFVLGAVAIRARGVYFALITFGAAEILSKIAHNTRAIGGSDGILGIPVPTIPLASRRRARPQQQFRLLLRGARRHRSALCRHATDSRHAVRLAFCAASATMPTACPTSATTRSGTSSWPTCWRRRSPRSAA